MVKLIHNLMSNVRRYNISEIVDYVQIIEDYRIT